MAATTPWTIEALARFFRIIDDADAHDDVWWRANEPQYEPFKLLINCNDLFHWACADCEEVTPESLDLLEQCVAELKPMNDAWWRWYHKGGRERGDPEPPHVHASVATQLFCARVRGMRPQGAYYKHFPPGVRELFDAAGTPRGPEDGDTRRREYREAQ